MRFQLRFQKKLMKLKLKIRFIVPPKSTYSLILLKNRYLLILILLFLCIPWVFIFVKVNILFKIFNYLSESFNKITEPVSSMVTESICGCSSKNSEPKNKNPSMGPDLNLNDLQPKPKN